MKELTIENYFTEYLLNVRTTVFVVVWPCSAGLPEETAASFLSEVIEYCQYCFVTTKIPCARRSHSVW